MTPPILTVPACASILGVHRNTLLRWVQTLPEWQACVASRVGRRTYLSRERLMAAGFDLSQNHNR